MEERRAPSPMDVPQCVLHLIDVVEEHGFAVGGLEPMLHGFDHHYEAAVIAGGIAQQLGRSVAEIRAVILGTLFHDSHPRPHLAVEQLEKVMDTLRREHCPEVAGITEEMQNTMQQAVFLHDQGGVASTNGDDGALLGSLWDGDRLCLHRGVRGPGFQLNLDLITTEPGKLVALLSNDMSERGCPWPEIFQRIVEGLGLDVTAVRPAKLLHRLSE